MTRSSAVWVSLLLAVVVPSPLRAAAGPPPGKGALVGAVFDPTGTPVAGVKVTATPSTLPRKQSVAYTDQKGEYQFPALRPDSYKVLVQAPKLRPALAQAVKVEAGKTTEHLVIVEPLRASRVESVAVLQQAPRVSTTHANLKESYDAGFIESGHISGLPIEAEPAFNTESYDHVAEGAFASAAQQPLSTFAIDVDTAAYANTRRFIQDGQIPPAGAVRVEELLNYFPYDYAAPTGDAAFAASFDEGPCPWNPAARLVRVGLRGRDVPLKQHPPANLVFLIDVSGSMAEPNKLPLVQRALALLVEQLRPQDHIALAVYAGASGLVLPPTAVAKRAEILNAIEMLSAGGSTNGASGITLAYQTARQGFKKGGNNRVILATDGDFNVGVTSQDQLVALIEKEAKAGVFLTVLGFGTGNLKDSTMEKLADHGNGNYAYIDSLSEARKVLVEQMAGTMLTIAKDVKIQVELNPARVGAYRLIGYENRRLAAQDFNDDRKDGGEIGAGHTVTALYEILPPGEASAKVMAGATVDPLRYVGAAGAPAQSPELLTLKVRFKEPDGTTSRKLEFPLLDRGMTAAPLSTDLRFAAAVAAFGMVLRNSPLRGQADLALVQRLLDPGLGADPFEYRRGFLELVAQARKLPLAATMWPPTDGHLIVEQDTDAGVRRREVAVAGGRLVGQVEGAAFDVRVAGSELAGHVGGEPLWLHTRRDEAEGHIGGHDVGFVLHETPRGHLLRGVSVGHTVRLEQEHGTLSWLPGCDRPLLRLPRISRSHQVYQGTCASGRRTRITVPAAFEALAPLPRLVLLALLLDEPERPGARGVLSGGGTR